MKNFKTWAITFSILWFALFIPFCKNPDPNFSLNTHSDFDNFKITWLIEKYICLYNNQIQKPGANNEGVDFLSIKSAKSVLLFIPSSTCNSCFSRLFQHLIDQAKIYNVGITIVCDESNVRECMMKFPDLVIYSWKHLDEIYFTQEIPFPLNPFLYVIENGNLFGLFITDKDKLDVVETYFSFWFN